MNKEEKQKKSDTQVAGLVSATYVGLAGAFGKGAAELANTPNEFAAPYLAVAALACLFPALRTARDYKDEVPLEFAKGMVIPFLALNLIWGKIEYDHNPDDLFSRYEQQAVTPDAGKN